MAERLAFAKHLADEIGNVNAHEHRCKMASVFGVILSNRIRWSILGDEEGVNIAKISSRIDGPLLGPLGHFLDRSKSGRRSLLARYDHSL